MTLSKNDLPSAQMPQTNFDTEAAAAPTRGRLLVDDLPSRRHVSVTDNLENASQLNPDREATVQRLSKQTGYAPEFINANFDNFQKRQALPGNKELDELRDTAPETYSLLNNKETVPLIQDEYKKMGFFERNFKMVLNAFKKSWKQDTLADLRIKQREYDLQTKTYGTAYDDEITLLEREIADLAAPTGNVFTRAPYHATEFATQILLSQPDAIAGAAVGAGGGAVVGAGVGAAGLGAGAVPGAITGATWGARGGYIAGMAKYANDMEGGLAYGDLRNLRDANGNPVPVEIADKASRTVGYINAALETAGDLIFIGGVLKPAGKLAGKVGSKFVGKSLSGALGKTLAKVPGAEGLIKIIEGNPAAFEGLTLRQTFAKAAQQWAITTASETSTEYMQNVVQLTAEEAAKVASKQPFERRTISGVMGESLEGMDEVFVGSGALGLIGFGGNFHRHMRATQEAARVGELYKQLGNGVKELKLTERAPDKAIAFLASQTNGTPMENLYIPIKAIDRVAEENNIDPREFLQAIGPEAAGQYDEAKATGGDIEIKTASWAVQSQLYSKLTGKPMYEALERDIKISPEARTQNELAAEEQEVAKIVNEQAEQMLKEGQIKQDELDNATQTWTNVLAQSVPPAGIEAEEWQKQVEANAQLMARMSVVEAKKRGQDFAEFAEHLNLPTVQTQLAPEQKQAFDQAKEVYAKIKDALTQNEETLAAQEKGGATPIIDYLLKRGGVATENTDWAGETENWRRKESNIFGLVNNKNGMKLYEAALAVQEYLEENGYGSLIDLGDVGATTADVPDLIAAVNEEMGKYIPLTKRDRYNKRLNEILNVNSGQFKTLFEKEFGEKLPDRGTRALKNLHYFLLREAVKDGMMPSETVLAEHNINAEALTAGSFDLAQDGKGRDLFQFAGQNAKTADPLKLAEAEKLLKEGKDPEEVRKKTGWFKGADGKMRFEISDKDAEIRPAALEHFGKRMAATDNGRQLYNILKSYQDEQKNEPNKYKPGVIEELIQMADRDLSKANQERYKYMGELRLDQVLKHDKLFEAYPYLREVKVDINDGIDGALGAYYDHNKTIVLDGDMFNAQKHKFNKAYPQEKRTAEIKSVLMHEIQHSIQRAENFARGGSPESVRTLLREALGKYENSPARKNVVELARALEVTYAALRTKEVMLKPAKVAKTDWFMESNHGRYAVLSKKEQKPYLEKMAKDYVAYLESQYQGNPKYESLLKRDLKEVRRQAKNTHAQWVRAFDKINPTEAGKIREAFNTRPGNEYELYRALAGEIEARNTQARADMTDEQRAATSPESTQDVANKNALVVFDDGTTATYAPQRGREFFQTAYHGSPYRFNQFSTDAIGTGEGAQTHGWGIYFAQNKGVAIDYRTREGRVGVYYKGKNMEELRSMLERTEQYDRAALVEDFMIKMDDSALDTDMYSKKDIAWFKRSILPFVTQEGSLIKAEIPENDVLLDEQKTLAEQPQKVQDALKQIPYLTDEVNLETADGGDIYGAIVNHFAAELDGQYDDLNSKNNEAQKRASLFLNSLGVKGIAYNGGMDGRCYVVFDDKAIDILNQYYQRAAGRMRGKFNELTNTITIMPDANASTLTHELAHYWLNERWQFLNSGLASEEYKKDFAPLAKYLEITDGQKELSRAQHEKFAKSFEAYLREGKSPSLEMERLFGRLRRWMLRVYKDVKKQLGVELNDDIRRVFDRMLATEEEIVAAERERTYEPFTKTPGLSAEDVARLERLREDAHNKAVMQIMKEEADEWEFANNAKYAYAEDRESEVVEKELAARSDYQLANIVESHFIDSQYAKDHNKTDANNLASAKELAHAFHANLLSEADRTLWTVIAENNGMTGTQMAEELVTLKPFREAVADEVNKRMEKYKLNKDMRDLRRAQAEALSTDRALDVLALERDLFLNFKRTASVQRAQETKALAKKAAREWLHSKPARIAARFSPYYTAQKRAATRAARALARQDYEAAAEAKMEELFNAAAAAESVRISKQLRRLQENLKYFQRKKIQLLKKQDHYLQMADLLFRLGYARNDYEPSMKMESLAEWAKRYKELGYDGVMIPDWITNESRNLDWRRLSIDSLQQAVDAIKNINHTANFENRLFSMHRRQTISDLAFMTAQHLSKTISQKTREKYKDQVEPEKDGFGSGVAKYFYSMTKLDTLLHKADGYHDFGFMWDLFGQPTKEAADKESVHMRAFKDAYKKLIDEHYTQDELQEIFNTKKYHPELGDECTKERLLAMALNMGNEQNRKRLFDNPPVGHRYIKNPDGSTNEWTQESVEQMLRNNLTAKDWDFVQGVWDLINEPWGAVSEMHQRLTGFTPGKVEALSFAIATADGKTAQLRGGYYPIKYDWRGSRWAEREEYLAQPLYTESNQAWAATTKQGHTKARAKEVHQPLALNLNLVERHMTEVIHDLYFRPVVVDMRRLLDNDYMRETLIKNLGRNGYGLLKAHLNMIATGGQETSGIGVINKTVEWLRKHTTIAVLAGKSSVIIENLANPWLFTNAVEGFTGKDVLKGVALAMSEYGPQSLLGMKNAKQLQEFVFSKSSLMKDKSENYDVTMRQLRKANIFGEDSMLLEFTNAAMVATDDFFAIPMWVTAYNKWFDMATKEGKKDKEADRIAIDRADMLINRVLGSGRRYDAAEIMRNRNAIVRCLTMFATFMNNEFNRWSRETGLLLDEHDAIRYAGFVGGRLLVWHTMSQLLAGKWPDDLSPDELLKWWFSGLVDNVSGMFVGVRDILPVLLAKTMGWQTFGYRPTPISGTLEEMILRPAEAVSGYVRGKKSGQDTSETVAKAASYLAPYPNQLNTWFFNAYDYVFNGSTPRPRDLYRRRPKKERGN